MTRVPPAGTDPCAPGAGAPSGLKLASVVRGRLEDLRVAFPRGRLDCAVGQAVAASLGVVDLPQPLVIVVTRSSLIVPYGAWFKLLQR